MGSHLTLWQRLQSLFAALIGVQSDKNRQRDAVANKLGKGPYRGLFSLLILTSLLLIVFGWKAATPSAVYSAPLAG